MDYSRECFIAYHPDDRVESAYCSIGDGVRFVFGEHRITGYTTFPLRDMFQRGATRRCFEQGDIVWE